MKPDAFMDDIISSGHLREVFEMPLCSICLFIYLFVATSGAAGAKKELPRWCQQSQLCKLMVLCQSAPTGISASVPCFSK